MTSDTPIGFLQNITPDKAATLDILDLDKARTEYQIAVLAHRLEAADYILNDTPTARAHMGEAWRLGASLTAIYDELSMRRIRLHVLNAIKEGTTHGSEL